MTDPIKIWRIIELLLPTCKKCGNVIYEIMQVDCIDCRISKYKAVDEIGVPFSACEE